MLVRVFFLLPGLGLCPAQEPQHQEPQPQEPQYYARSTTKLFQLTGDYDRPRQLPTKSLTGKTAGVDATDLGSSFEHKGKLYFLFGDTWGGPRDADVLAFTEATEPDQMRLRFHLDEKGKFLPLRVPGLRLGAFEIPSYGISVDDRIYGVFTTDHSRRKTMGRSVMAVSKNDGRDFKALYDLSTTEFINVALAHARRGDWPGLPVEKGILVYGSGQYRRSSPRLAVVPASGIHDKKTYRYLQGLEAGRPRWTRQEARAMALFDHPVVGELSVAWVEQLERWVMLYNSSLPRGIVMRTAKTPWGPWSKASVIFDPHKDGGYGQFMHAPAAGGQMDNFHDPRRSRTWGGEYGPYLISRFISGSAERCTLVYTMSTWNPYQVVVMSSDVGYPASTDLPKAKEIVTQPPKAPWQAEHFTCRTFEKGGETYVTTYVEKGDRDVGVAHWAFRCGREAELSFLIQGGLGEVVLVLDEKEPPGKPGDLAAYYKRLKAGEFGRVLEAIAGPRQNKVPVPIRWNLRRFAGQKLRLFVIDHHQGVWGFVDLAPFHLRQA